MQSSLSNTNDGLYPSYRMRNNSYSTTTITNPPFLQTPPSLTLNFNNGPTSIQQFLNSDMLASMSRSNSQPDLTAALNTAQASVNQLTSSKSMSVCSDDLYMEMNVIVQVLSMIYFLVSKQILLVHLISQISSRMIIFPN